MPFSANSQPDIIREATKLLAHVPPMTWRYIRAAVSGAYMRSAAYLLRLNIDERLFTTSECEA